MQDITDEDLQEGRQDKLDPEYVAYVERLFVEGKLEIPKYRRKGKFIHEDEEITLCGEHKELPVRHRLSGRQLSHYRNSLKNTRQEILKRGYDFSNEFFTGRQPE